MTRDELHFAIASSPRRKGAVALATLALATLGAGCGGDDEAQPSGTASSGSTGSSQVAKGDSTTGKGKPESPAKGGKGEGSTPSEPAVDNREEPGPDVGKPGPGDDGRDPNRPAKSPITKSAPDFVGLFTREVSGGDLSGSYRPAGRWSLAMGVNSFQLSSKARGYQAKLAASDQRLTFTTPTGKAAKGDSCAGTKGTYRYALADQVLTLTPVRDACAARRSILDSEWTQRQ